MTAAAEAAAPASRILDKKSLCEELGWSRMKLDRRLEGDAAFPVKSRGDQGAPWEFDLAEVRSYLDGEPADAGDAEEEASEATPRKAAHQGEETARQRRDAAQAQLLEDKIARERGKLVEAEPLKLALSETVARVASTLNALPDVLVRRLNLPESALPVIRTEIDGVRRQLVIGLRDQLKDG